MQKDLAYKEGPFWYAVKNKDPEMLAFLIEQSEKPEGKSGAKSGAKKWSEKV
jgi:hypothetical protein